MDVQNELRNDAGETLNDWLWKFYPEITIEYMKTIEQYRKIVNGENSFRKEIETREEELKDIAETITCAWCGCSNNVRYKLDGAWNREGLCGECADEIREDYSELEWENWLEYRRCIEVKV